MTLAPTSSTSETLSAPWIRQLLSQLTDAIGSKMADLYAGRERVDVEREWEQGLADMTREELARGVQAARLRPFAVNVSEFAHLCRPALDPEYAFSEAQTGLAARDRGEKGEWSHPAVYRAAMNHAWDVHRRTYREMRRIWNRALAIELEKGWGDDVPPVPRRIEHRPTLSPMPAAVSAKLAELHPVLANKWALKQARSGAGGN